MAAIIPVPTPTGGFASLRIVYIEPDGDTGRSLAGMLGELGAGAAVGCANVREAWKLIESGAYNVVLMDWSSTTDAPGFLRVLRADTNPHRYLPVVVMAASGEADAASTARDAGANEFLLRPFSANILATRLRSLMNAPRLFVRAESYFGPDRRRRRADFQGSDRRSHENWRNQDRRNAGEQRPWSGPERRQGHPGFSAWERRMGPRDRPM